MISDPKKESQIPFSPRICENRIAQKASPAPCAQSYNADNAAHNRTKDGGTCPVDCGKIGNQHNIDTGD